MPMSRVMFVVVATLVVGLGIFAGCEAPETPTPTPMVWDMHNSRPIAERFLLNSRTFVFDGLPYTMELKNIERQRDICDTCFVFHFTFQTAHPGYGDRAGQVLAEVVTTHEAAITVQRGLVTAGVIDGKWDMLAQRYLPGTGP